MLTSIKFFASISQVEVLRSGYHIGESMTPGLHRWRNEDGLMVNDFVRVLKGDRVGQEGIVTHLLEGCKAEICLTADYPDVSFKSEHTDNVTKSAE